ncbi:MAG: hypothetical protein ACYCYM_15205, partial [Saccharofermentanales bacterium]
ALRFLPTLGHPHAVALRFVRCDQLTGGLSPPRVRPCRAHKKKRRQADGVLFFFNIYLSLSFAQGGSAKNQTRSALPKQRLWPSSKE